MLRGLLAGDERLLFHYFEFPDRVGHVFWRFRDPQHPAYDAALASRVRRRDRKVVRHDGRDRRRDGEGAEARGRPDRSFGSRLRHVAPVRQLQLVAGRDGYLVLKGDARRQNLEALFSRGQFWEAVDWSQSKAYAMGLGDIYVNLRGREQGGIVAPGAEYEALRSELSERLIALTDPKTNEKAVSRVFKREDVYRRFDPRLIPDLIVANRPGYRVSWQSSLGVPTATVFEDNRDVWSGDHCSLDPDLVRGVLFASRPFRADPIPGIADVTASVRALAGAPVIEDAGRKDAVVSRLAAASFLLLVALPGLGQQNLPPGSSERRADLDRLQNRIASLKTKLAESEKKEATLAEELQRLELRLELATREGELVAATREEFGRRLAAVSEERAAAAAAAARLAPGAADARAAAPPLRALRLLPRLLEARDLPALLDSIERLDSLARRDGRLLQGHRRAESRLQED